MEHGLYSDWRDLVEMRFEGQRSLVVDACYMVEREVRDGDDSEEVS